MVVFVGEGNNFSLISIIDLDQDQGQANLWAYNRLHNYN